VGEPVCFAYPFLDVCCPFAGETVCCPFAGEPVCYLFAGEPVCCPFMGESVCCPFASEPVCCPSWVKLYAARLWVNNQTILPACLWVYNSPQFERSYVSVWRDSTAQYNVADHPFFVFHPKPVDCSSF